MENSPPSGIGLRVNGVEETVAVAQVDELAIVAELRLKLAMVLSDVVGTRVGSAEGWIGPLTWMGDEVADPKPRAAVEERLHTLESFCSIIRSRRRSQAE